MKNIKQLIQDLKRGETVKTTFNKGVLNITITSEELKCCPDEIGTGVMEEFWEDYSYDISLWKIKRCISTWN